MQKAWEKIQGKSSDCHFQNLEMSTRFKQNRVIVFTATNQGTQFYLKMKNSQVFAESDSKKLHSKNRLEKVSLKT